MKGSDKNFISPLEFSVLNLLSNKGELTTSTEVQELAVTTGTKDHDEILRALYTLEGKSLVTPIPEGDFTSNRWKITIYGHRAVRMVQETQQAVVDFS